jgi:hypothetical protein
MGSEMLLGVFICLHVYAFQMAQLKTVGLSEPLNLSKGRQSKYSKILNKLLFI